MKNVLKKTAYRIRNFLIRPVYEEILATVRPDIGCQLQLKLAYKAISEMGTRLPRIDEVGFKAFSQTDEDGILLYIFSIIGSENRQCVEICAGNGIECNTANLIINHGWSGLLVDGNERLVKRGIEFYKRNRHTYVYPPTFVYSWVTRNNVNDLIRKHGFVGQVDLLSIDMDGVDYWIWESIEAIEPRVVIIEYQDIIGPERSLTIPYSDNFNAYEYPTTRGMPNFAGASLTALVKLGRKKGYRLVGCNRCGFNAFFIRNPLGQNDIPEVSIRECFKHPKVLWGMKERFPLVKDLPWVEV